MNINKVKNMSILTCLVYFIKERESIRLKKKTGEKRPWTDDAILDKYRFCNIRRMDDAVSSWLFRNWYEPHFNSPNMMAAVGLARHFNLPETLSQLGFPHKWEPSKLIKVLDKIKLSGHNLFNSAYIITGGLCHGRSKQQFCLDTVTTMMKTKIDMTSMDLTHKALTQVPGLGSFMAGQITADLRWAVKGLWRDKETWTPQGPGSTRGVNRFYGQYVNFKIPPATFQKQLAHIIMQLKRKLPTTITSRLEGIDWQNCMCEADKYQRTLFGEGSPKQIYRSK